MSNKSIKTLFSREFQQNASQAQKAAQHGPVFITSRGEPVNVLPSIEEYRRLTGKRQKIADLLSMPGIADLSFRSVTSCPARRTSPDVHP